MLISIFVVHLIPWALSLVDSTERLTRSSLLPFVEARTARLSGMVKMDRRSLLSPSKASPSRRSRTDQLAWSFLCEFFCWNPATSHFLSPLHLLLVHSPSPNPYSSFCHLPYILS